jgi:hypothetical protein
MQFPDNNKNPWTYHIHNTRTHIYTYTRKTPGDHLLVCEACMHDSHVWHDSSMCSSALKTLCSHSCVWHTSNVWHDSFIYMLPRPKPSKWVSRCVTCDRSQLWHDSDLYVWPDSFLCVQPRLQHSKWAFIHMCDVTQTHVCVMALCSLSHV